jgi:hypothetical protein
VDCRILSAMGPAMSMGFVILATGFICVGWETGFSWLVLGLELVGLRRHGIGRIRLGE